MFVEACRAPSLREELSQEHQTVHGFRVESFVLLLSTDFSVVHVCIRQIIRRAQQMSVLDRVSGRESHAVWFEQMNCGAVCRCQI